MRLILFILVLTTVASADFASPPATPQEVGLRDRAIATRNAKLCMKIDSLEYRDRCIKYVSDEIVEHSKTKPEFRKCESLRLMPRLEDPYVNCVIGLAMKFKDLTLCTEIKLKNRDHEYRDQKKCFRAFGSPLEACKELKTEESKDRCFDAASACDQIKDETLKDRCEKK